MARDKRQRFETAEEFHLALDPGAYRPLSEPSATPPFYRDLRALWKAVSAASLLLNLLLGYWIFFLPN